MKARFNELTGAEKLSIANQVEILSQALGTPIKYVDVPPSAAREGMIQSGMPVALADAVTELFDLVRKGYGGNTTVAYTTLTGKAPRTFEDWCRDHVDAFR